MSEMAARNRRLLAERLGWPDGAVEAVEALEDEWPGLRCAWFPENTSRGFERKPGFYAWLRGDQPGVMKYRDHEPVYVRRREWYGMTADEVVASFLGSDRD